MAAKAQKYKNEKDEILPLLPKVCADERAAVEFFEAMRWPDGAACPRCGDVAVRQMKDKEGNRNARFLWKCSGCKKQFTVRVGTVMEDSPIPLTAWAFTFWQATASKKGVAAKQIERQCRVSYKSALFLMHRVRWAMVDNGGAKLTGTVECDETYVGGKPRDGRDPKPRPRGRGRGVHTPVIATVERATGTVRTRVIANVTADNLERVLKETTHRSATIHTDELAAYKRATRSFAAHESVAHRAGEYARDDVHCNGAESFFSRLKRSVMGVHHRISREHLHRYVSHMEFLHNHRHLTDGLRLAEAIRGADGKRLTYRAVTT